MRKSGDRNYQNTVLVFLLLHLKRKDGSVASGTQYSKVE